MKDAQYIANKILARIRCNPRASPASPSDFFDLGSRSAVDQALSRLVRRGKLYRVSRGLYALPRVSRLTGGLAVSSPDGVARSIARKLGLRILPSRPHASNLLGLSTQVPAKLIYLTDGRSRIVRAGPFTLQFRHASPRTMAVSGRIAPIVFQALRDLRRNGVSKSHVARLCRLLRQKDKQDLLKNLPYAPGWMKPILLQVAGQSAKADHGSDCQSHTE